LPQVSFVASQFTLLTGGRTNGYFAQGALVLAKSGRDWETIFYGHYRSTVNHCERRNWPAKLSNSMKKRKNKGNYAVQGHSRLSRSVSIESPYATA